MMTNENNLILISNEIISSKNILVITHEKPDGDAIGSVLALTNFLNDNKFNASAYFSEDLPKNYKPFANFSNIIIGELSSYNDYDKVFSLDCSNFMRLGLEEKIRNKIDKTKLINLDHHFDNELFGSLNYIDSSACSTCEILYDLFRILDSYKVSKKTAEYILLGIIMDTGGFRFDNSSSKIFYKVASLMELGADYMYLIKSIYFKNELNLLKLESDIILNHLKWNFNNRFVYTYMSPEILDKYKVDLKNTEGLIDTFRTLEGVDIAALITQRGDGYKISLRSNNTDYSVVDIAHKLNGGGHKLAAGCFVKSDSIKKVENILIPLVGNLIGF